MKDITSGRMKNIICSSTEGIYHVSWPRKIIKETKLYSIHSFIHLIYFLIKVDIQIILVSDLLHIDYTFKPLPSISLEVSEICINNLYIVQVIIIIDY